MIETQPTNLDKMHKRRELMEDGRRYIIFYTFGDRETEELNRLLHDAEAQRETADSKQKQ